MKKFIIIAVMIILIVLVLTHLPPTDVNAAVEEALEFGSIELIPVLQDGTQANAFSSTPAITPDGRFVVFITHATNLVSEEVNGYSQVYIKDMETKEIELVSTTPDGTVANDGCLGTAVSSDGRYVVFGSYATNLVENDVNDEVDIFLKDRQTGLVELISISETGIQSDDVSQAPAISADGGFVAFASFASTLVPGDTNGYSDVFVKDRQTGVLERVSTTVLGEQVTGNSSHPDISDDGRYVAFYSTCGQTCIVTPFTNPSANVVVKDRLTGVVEVMSETQDGTQANNWSSSASITGDGRYVSFFSHANNLVPNDTNGEEDVFIKDRVTGVVELISSTNEGEFAVGGDSQFSTISDSGRYVVFDSEGTNLVENDTNSNYDVFLKDRFTGKTIRLSLGVNQNQGTGWSFNPRISGDGKYVVFPSSSSNFIPNDYNNTSDIFLVTLENDTNAPILLTPIGGNESSDNIITYTWDVVEGAQGYELEILKKKDGSPVHNQYYEAQTYCDETTCSVTVVEQLCVGKYEWRVAGVANDVYGDWSSYRVFTVLPQQTQLRSPGVDAAVYGGRPTFKWYFDADATSYMIEFYDPSDALIGEWQKAPVCDEDNYCEYRIPRDMDLGSAYGEYDWRVRTISNGIAGPWSEMRTFTYTALERTYQISPEDGFTTADTTPTFEWAEITGATMYLFQVRLPDDTLVRNILVSDATYCTDGGSCVWTIDDGILDPNTTYKWHVRAKNGRNFGRWTAYRTIIITE